MVVGLAKLKAIEARQRERVHHHVARLLLSELVAVVVVLSIVSKAATYWTLTPSVALEAEVAVVATTNVVRIEY